MKVSEPSGCQLGSGHRLLGTTGDEHVAPTVELAHAQPGAIPRHVRVIPLNPAQPLPIRTPPRVAHEIRAAHEYLGSGRPVRCQADDLISYVESTIARRVMLPDACDPLSVRREITVGIAVTAFHSRLWHERLGRARLRIEPVEPLVIPVHEPHHPVARPPRPAAVLVDRSPGILTLPEQISGAPVARPADELDPSPLGRTTLRPDDVLTVHPNVVELNRGRDYDRRGHGSPPRPVGQHLSTGPLSRHRHPHTTLSIRASRAPASIGALTQRQP